jgi:hypothetical protein
MIKEIFKNALVGTALAGTVFATAQPEMTGAAISSAKDAFNQGYVMEITNAPPNHRQLLNDTPTAQSTILQDVFFTTGEKYAQFQRGLENPESLSELIQKSNIFPPTQNNEGMISSIESQFEEDGLYEKSLIENIKEHFEDEGLYRSNAAISPPALKPS